MSYPAFKNIIRTIIIILFILSLTPFLCAQEVSQGQTLNRGIIYSKQIPDTKKGTVILKEGTSNFSLQEQEENLSILQKQSRDYRRKGLELQRIGNLAGAMSLYQKAIELDPAYGVTYNDLGILYETNGDIDRAEQSYIQAIKINPNYLSAYSNLALLYENKRDLPKAHFYWAKRAELGVPDDPWTQKAKVRLEDIRLVLGEKTIESKEQEVIGLVKDVVTQKYLQKQDSKQLAKMHFEKAKLNYQKGNEVVALKEACDAKQLDPTNKEIDKFIEKLQTRLLSR